VDALKGLHLIGASSNPVDPQEREALIVKTVVSSPVDPTQHQDGGIGVGVSLPNYGDSVSVERQAFSDKATNFHDSVSLESDSTNYDDDDSVAFERQVHSDKADYDDSVSFSDSVKDDEVRADRVSSVDRVSDVDRVSGVSDLATLAAVLADPFQYSDEQNAEEIAH
jgi:hypothetical protein